MILNAESDMFMQPDIARHCVTVIEKYRTEQNVPVETLTQFIGDTSGVRISSRTATG